MKKLLLISMLIGALPLSIVAQDDDLYFVPKKKKVDKVTDNYGLPKESYYSGSDRSIDEYNRRRTSTYEVIDGDSAKSDIIDFCAEKGVYPDSVEAEDFALTKQMSRFDDYEIADNAAFWAGYEAGSHTWGWHSPWYYSRYGWYGGWYDPWYSPWYYPGYYSSWYYGWYDPWFYGGWYDPWLYRYYGSWWPSYYYYGWGGGHYHATVPHIGTGTIRRDGGTHSSYGRGSIAGSNSRTSTLRSRTVGNHVRYDRNSSASRSSGRYSGARDNSSFGGSRSSGNYGSSSARSSGSYSSGGGFSGGGSRGGGGGGSRMGGRR